jgi:dihydroorotate dehydrogenase
MYRLLFRLILRRMPAETAHRLSFAALRAIDALPGARATVTALLRRLCGTSDPVLRVRAFGLDLPGPLGLAAGFDKDAAGPDAFGMLGFDLVEIGTVTARPQPGNPRPRMFRLIADRAVVNRMGFNNHGAAAAARRLAARRGRPLVVGANIGKTKTTPEQDALADYVTSARALAGVADYLVVNVSSPNTPGLRDLQATHLLRPLLRGVRAALDEASPDRRVPLLVKIAPDLADEDVDAVADLVLDLGLDGIIATNTTIGRDGLRTPAEQVRAIGAGGLSGAPLADRALVVLRRLRARVGARVVLVAAGGVADADDAYQRIRAGASLVQAYTGLVYGGPLWPHQLRRDLARRLRAAGYDRLEQAIGADVTVDEPS